jgi:hypothetical protein
VSVLYVLYCVCDVTVLTSKCFDGIVCIVLRVRCVGIVCIVLRVRCDGYDVEMHTATVDQLASQSAPFYSLTFLRRRVKKVKR